ncbi:protein ROLLING AND ERECT LEAF 2-like [Zingiber officinale]|uniref:Nitrate regulatory gene2 protein-like n=1 Tax=Zingiber officinale TaxID=94328 RepID=A0A8J5H2F2_ZINOF|nr:protein ROLLING AND ERECT LEAF 2-like [Zingiber officinale]KAG6519551.1 hypothetical protein ZIOFF_023045 [Zingiber officinale]
MGCTQSAIENEDSVMRCKNRKHYLRDAVASRNAFAAAQAAYTVTLKNTGAALSDFGKSELNDVAPSHSHNFATGAASSSSASAVGIKAPVETLPPPPPPPPADSSVAAASLQRAASMPADVKVPKSKKKLHSKIPTDAAIDEEDEGERADDDRSTTGSSSPSPPPRLHPQFHPRSQEARPPPETSGTWDFFFSVDENMMSPTLSQPEDETTWPQKRKVEQDKTVKVKTTPPPRSDEVHHQETPLTPTKLVNEQPPSPSKSVKKVIKHSAAVEQQPVASAGATEAKKSRTMPTSVNLLQILIELDDHFLRASESAHEVTKMLETPRLHYHSNFADNRGHIDHSAILMRVITWNRSFKGISQAESAQDDFVSDELETHGTILDKMLAWEKKLYDEVRAGEFMKIEYKKKLVMLNKLEKRGINSTTLGRTKSAVSHLQTRYIVDMQSMDATVSEINQLRDDHLYIKLVELVNGMARMWEKMCSHHRSQLKLIKDIRTIDIQLPLRETSQQHHKRTVELRNIVGEWDLQLQKLIDHQKDYIKFLNSWLNLNIIPLENSGKETSSPRRQPDPPIKVLLHDWQDQLENLPVNRAKIAIGSFSASLHAVVLCQIEELNLKLKWDDARRDHERRKREFEEWNLKYMQKMAEATGASNGDRKEGTYEQDNITERRLAVENADIKLKGAEEAYRKQCKMVRDKSLATLKTHLPDLFRVMSDFSYSCSAMYNNLSSVTGSHNPAKDS